MNSGIRVPAHIGMWTCLFALRSGALVAEPPDDVERVRTAAAQSVSLMQAGRYDEARVALEEGFKASARLDRDNEWLGLLYHNQGSYYQDLRNCDAGLGAYRRAMRVWERNGHPMVFLTAVSLGSFHLECGEPAEAEIIWKNVLEKRVSGLHETDLRVARALALRGGILMVRKKYAEAEPLVRRALDIWQRQLGPDEVRTVSIRNTLALLHAHMRRYDEAVQDERQAVAVVERAYGAGHPLLARLYGNLSAIYDRAGRGAEAEASCRKALDLAVAGFGSDSPVTADLLQSHSVLLRKLNRRAEADQAQSAARAIQAEAWRARSHTVDAAELKR